MLFVLLSTRSIRNLKFDCVPQLLNVRALTMSNQRKSSDSTSKKRDIRAFFAPTNDRDSECRPEKFTRVAIDLDGAVDANDDDDLLSGISNDVLTGVDSSGWRILYDGFVRTQFDTKEKVVAAVRIATQSRGND